MILISSGEPEQQFLAIDEKASSVDLKVNRDQTKYMLSSLREPSHDRVGPNFRMVDYNFEVVRNLIYLEPRLNEELSSPIDVFTARVKLLRSKQLSRKTKGRPYHQLITITFFKKPSNKQLTLILLT
ncbi:hypothetical protein ACFFRR_007386 [Megaselia abdita]